MDRRRRPSGIAAKIATCALALILVGIPAWLVFVGAAKSEAAAASPDLVPPEHWMLVENVGFVMAEGDLAQGFANTLLVTVPAVTGTLLMGTMAAWVFARGRSRWLSGVYYASVAAIFFPPAVIATLQVLRALNVYGEHAGLVLVYFGIFIPIAILLISGFVKTIPVELEEAARIDGAGHFTVFFRVIVPLLAPVLVTGGFIVTVSIWNDFFFPLLVLSSGSQSTLTLNLYEFVNSGGEYNVRWNLVFANVALSVLPMLAVYALIHRRVLSGLTSGAVTG